jgi:triacylglycerol lipase
VAVVGLAWAGLATGAGAAEPSLTVPPQKLRAALHCDRHVGDSRRAPVLLVTGTGFSGTEVWTGAGGVRSALREAGHASCHVDFPRFTTVDIQVSVQYLVWSIRRAYRRAGRRLVLYGVSQGALMPRWALTYWPDLRRKVSDVVAVAGPQHGTTFAGQAQVFAGLCAPTAGCPAAFWQQATGSHLLRALNGRPDESPGPTDWTTVRSLTDDLVQPELGPYPTSSLFGASNVLIQRVCPGRATDHIGTASDSVSFAALLDAARHRGPARASRLPAATCSRPFGRGIDPARARGFDAGAFGLVATRLADGTFRSVPREPPVRSYARLGGRP